MFIGKAKDLCADLITLPYEFDKYSSTAEAMYRLVFDLTPHVSALAPTRARHTPTRTPTNTHTGAQATGRKQGARICEGTVGILSADESGWGAQVQGVSVDEAYADVTAVVAAMDPAQDVGERTRIVAENLRRAVREATECNASVSR
jgi:hypothetical protein